MEFVYKFSHNLSSKLKGDLKKIKNKKLEINAFYYDLKKIYFTYTKYMGKDGGLSKKDPRF